MPVTVIEFNEFFQAKKNGTYKCPVCSHEEFVANIAESKPDDPFDLSRLRIGLLNVTATLDAGTPAVSAHNFYSISCTNCGHADLFHSAQFEAWRASKVSSAK